MGRLGIHLAKLLLPDPLLVDLLPVSLAPVVVGAFPHARIPPVGLLEYVLSKLLLRLWAAVEVDLVDRLQVIIQKTDLLHDVLKPFVLEGILSIGLELFSQLVDL